jgi:L,D-transpeptidase YcbB
MHRRLLPAACATIAAALALADLTPARAQATTDTQPPAATGTPPAPGAAAQPPAAATTPPGPEAATQPPAAAATPPAPEAAAAPPPPPPLDPLVAKVRELAGSLGRGKAAAADRAAVAPFYAERTSLLWVTSDGFTPRANHAMAEIAKAGDWGLDAQAFELPQLGDKSEAALAEAEIKLTLAVLKYANHARGGRLDPTDISRNIDRKPSLREPKVVLESVAATDTPGDYLRGLHPKHQQFERLRQALLKLRGGSAGQEKAEEVVRLPDGPVLKLGVDHPQVALLRKRLKIAASAGNENVFDADVQAAVEEFQRKSGSRPDGMVGSRTRAALNGGESGRPAFGTDEQRLLINMERWRWMPEDMGNFYVWNNIPEFLTRVVRNGQIIHQAKIIVGKPETPTVQFTADMRYVIFGPDWGVPDSIKVKEILPYLRPSSDGGFFGYGGTDTRVLERHNLRVTFNGRPVDASQVDWSQVDIRKFTFIQPPGPGNVLGDVKFRFPNKHDIYMHDTPQRELFNHSVRTFSHGCMRVFNPGRFAEVLLEEDKGWSAGHVKNLMSQGGNNTVTLTKTIPVHTTYFTVFVGDDGQVKSFGDFYGHDNRVARALAGHPLPLEPASVETVSARDAAKEARRRQYEQQSNNNNFFSGLFGN